MNSNTIETVANSSPISKTVFKALSDKQRARRATDLTNLFRIVHDMDQTIPEKDFLGVFKQLQDAKIGSLIIGRRNKHNRFLWNFNLKDVAQAAKGKKVEMKTAEETFAKKTGRKVIRRKTRRVMTRAPKMEASSSPVIQTPIIPEANTTLTASKGARLQFSLELSPNVSMKDVEALLILAQELQAK